MNNKHVLITGASSGIGLETARELGRLGYRLVLACRNYDKSIKVLNEIRDETGNKNIDLMVLDLSSMKSIKKFVQEFNNKYVSLDILINNAGRYSEYHEISEDGFEMTMAVNYYGLILLTELLLPKLEKTPNSKIINVGSKAGFYGKLNIDNINLNKGFSGFKAYSQSKYAVILYTKHLVERLKDRDIIINIVHPGKVITNIYSGETFMLKFMAKIMNRFSITAKEGAKTTINLVKSDITSSGNMYYMEDILEYPKSCNDVDLKNRLWDHTKKRLKDYL